MSSGGFDHDDNVKKKLAYFRVYHNKLSLKEQVDFLLNLVYEIRLNLCWPTDNEFSSSMVRDFMNTDVLTKGEKSLRLDSIWESTTEMLQILNKG